MATSPPDATYTTSPSSDASANVRPMRPTNDPAAVETVTSPRTPDRSRSDDVAASSTLPYQSVNTTSERSIPSDTSTFGGSSRTRSSTREPKLSGDAPFAKCAAAGANRSRPWNVDDTGSRRYAALVSSNASRTPPSESAPGGSKPLSGPTSTDPSAATTTTPRRSVP